MCWLFAVDMVGLLGWFAGSNVSGSLMSLWGTVKSSQHEALSILRIQISVYPSIQEAAWLMSIAHPTVIFEIQMSLGMMVLQHLAALPSPTPTVRDKSFGHGTKSKKARILGAGGRMSFLARVRICGLVSKVMTDLTDNNGRIGDTVFFLTDSITWDIATRGIIGQTTLTIGVLAAGPRTRSTISGLANIKIQI